MFVANVHALNRARLAIDDVEGEVNLQPMSVKFDLGINLIGGHLDPDHYCRAPGVSSNYHTSFLLCEKGALLSPWKRYVVWKPF